MSKCPNCGADGGSVLGCVSCGLGKDKNVGKHIEAGQDQLRMEQERQGSQNNGPCFVATAVYGNCDHPQVTKFRRFRDTRLNRSLAGKGLIKTYYIVGPILAFLPTRVPVVRKALRSILDRI